MFVRQVVQLLRVLPLLRKMALEMPSLRQPTNAMKGVPKYDK